jgi:hypothetical protein
MVVYTSNRQTDNGLFNVGLQDALHKLTTVKDYVLHSACAFTKSNSVTVSAESKTIHDTRTLRVNFGNELMRGSGESS